MLRAIELYTVLCTVSADTSKVKKVPRKGPNGPYYQQEFKVVLFCGQTELQAQISWQEGVSTSVRLYTTVFD